MVKNMYNIKFAKDLHLCPFASALTLDQCKWIFEPFDINYHSMKTLTPFFGIYQSCGISLHKP